MKDVAVPYASLKLRGKEKRNWNEFLIPSQWNECRSNLVNAIIVKKPSWNNTKELGYTGEASLLISKFFDNTACITLQLVFYHISFSWMT